MKSPVALRALLIAAALLLLLHTLTNGQYGFHRDELATLDDARHLAWGYVAYPPLTPFVGRIGLDLFGSAPAGVRLFTALAQAAVVVLGGLIARELGGGKAAQIMAALAVAASPVSMIEGHLFQYVSFDLLWQVLAAYFVIRLLESGDGRWWIGVGAAVGLGLMTRYTMVWFACGLTAGFFLTPARRLLKSRWLITGGAVALAICLPNILWQASHGFITYDFLRGIHARDIRIGRAAGFFSKQFLIPAAPLTIPLWIAGLFFYFRRPEGSRYRVLGWTFATTLLLFAVSRAREYYTAPLYPMLLAAGAVVASRWPRWGRGLAWSGVALSLGLGIAFLLPVAPVSSRWFAASLRVNGDLREEIGWHDLVERVANIRDALPPNERVGAGILTGNYGEAGAIDLYGPARGLPQALSRANSFWLRGYGEKPPATLIIVGLGPDFVNAHFANCDSAGTISNRFAVVNEETEYDKYLWICRGMRESWPVFWRKIRAWE
jgi:4-amino-4-deoxy-L-arabinose transferase-like glycosyltransferase